VADSAPFDRAIDPPPEAKMLTDVASREQRAEGMVALWFSLISVAV
jgi:hypothetical protein